MSLNFTTSLFQASTTDQSKSMVNALAKLKKRILNEFPKKVLIGDIITPFLMTNDDVMLVNVE